MLKIHSNKAFVDSRLKLCLSTFVSISLQKFCQLVLVSCLTWPENFIERIRYKHNHFGKGTGQGSKYLDMYLDRNESQCLT